MARLLARGRGGHIAERDQRILEHQAADPREDDDVEEADDHIDLAARLEQPEQGRADDRAEQPAEDHHPAHLQVDSAAAHVDHGSGDAGAGDLGRRRGHRDRRRDSVEDQQGRGEKAAADTEHARQDADREAQQDDEQRVDRLSGDREVDVHASAAGLAANRVAGQGRGARNPRPG